MEQNDVIEDEDPSGAEEPTKPIAASPSIEDLCAGAALPCQSVVDYVLVHDRDAWPPLVDEVLRRGPDEALVLDLLSLTFADATLTQFVAELAWRIIEEKEHHTRLTKATVRQCLDLLRGSYFQWLPQEMQELINSNLTGHEIVRLHRAGVHAEAAADFASSAAGESTIPNFQFGERLVFNRFFTMADGLGQTGSLMLFDLLNHEPLGMRPAWMTTFFALLEQASDEINDAIERLKVDAGSWTVREDVDAAIARFMLAAYGAVYPVVAQDSMHGDDAPLSWRESINELGQRGCELVLEGIDKVMRGGRFRAGADRPTERLVAILTPLQRNCEALLQRINTKDEHWQEVRGQHNIEILVDLIQQAKNLARRPIFEPELFIAMEFEGQNERPVLKGAMWFPTEGIAISPAKMQRRRFLPDTIAAPMSVQIIVQRARSEQSIHALRDQLERAFRDCGVTQWSTEWQYLG